MTPPSPPLEVFQKLDRFGSLTRPELKSDFCLLFIIIYIISISDDGTTRKISAVSGRRS